MRVKTKETFVTMQSCCSMVTIGENVQDQAHEIKKFKIDFKHYGACILVILYFQVQKNEKARCGALFERETKREKILDARQRELKLKERQRSGKGDRDGDETKKRKTKNVLEF